MMNPLWVDARDYLTSQGQPVTTHGLNAAMNLLASNPQLRPSAVKAGGGAAGIAAGLGAPTDQIVQTPLAPPASQGITETALPPPASPTPRGGGKHGASSGKRTAGGTSASGKTVKGVPGGVGNYAAAGSKDKSNQYGVTPPAPTPMGGYTPGVSYAGSPGSQERFTQNLQGADRGPSDAYGLPARGGQAGTGGPVGTAQAGTGAGDASDHWYDHLGIAHPGIAAAAIGSAVLMALGMRRGGEWTGMEGEVIPPSRMTTTGGARGEGPIINGDPIQELLGTTAEADYSGGGGGPTYGPEDYGAHNGRDPDAGPQGGPQVAGPQSFEEMIAQLAAQAPRGAIAPPVAKPPIQMRNQTSGPPIAIPPTGGQQLADVLRGLGRQ